MKNLLIFAAITVVASANAVAFTETEANNTRATGNNIAGIAAGDTISGTTTGTSTSVAGIGSADYFNVNVASGALAIYENRLTIGGTAAFISSLRGQTVSGALGAQTVSATSDTTMQDSSSTSSPVRFNQWYGFGKSETVQYRVVGAPTTTGGYTATFSQRVITPTSLGTVGIGALNISTNNLVGTPDTEIFLFDANLNVVAFGDDTLTAGRLSEISANLTNGTYYIAVGRYNTATNGLNSLANNGGIAGDFATGPVHANGGFISSSSSSTTATSFNLAFNGTNVGTGGWAGAADAYKMNWYSVEAVPEPATMTVMALGLAALARRRKNA